MRAWETHSEKEHRRRQGGVLAKTVAVIDHAKVGSGEPEHPPWRRLLRFPPRKAKQLSTGVVTQER